MGEKYKINKSALKALFATAEMSMENNYHSIYQEHGGWVKGKNNNFTCINQEAHGQSKDANPSMSVNNNNGQWHCFTCGIRGNFQSFWRDYLQDKHPSYSDFLIDICNINTTSLADFDTSSDPDLEKNTREIKALYDKMQKLNIQKRGRPWILHGELTKMIKESSIIPMEWLDKAVKTLLEDKQAMEYLYNTRRITESVVKKYRLGRAPYKGYMKYIFPTINAEGDLINAKGYDPGSEYKWLAMFEGYEYGPVPINNFTHQKLYFFEGEPDCYCAISHGYEGAVTLGSKGKHNVDDVFGKDHAKQIFNGKEIIICLDSDAKEDAEELAISLYPYAKQIKVINLDMNNINPSGLDPRLVKEIENKSGKKKIKRIEKDFTDFMKKNGFDEPAKIAFDKLVEKTLVFTHDVERLSKKTYKVTLQEARMSRYFSYDKSKELELTASVSDFNCDAYFYPESFTVTCQSISNDKSCTRSCNSCSIAEQNDFGKIDSVEIHLVRERTKENMNNPAYIKISDHDILGLIEVTDNQKVQNLKKACGINVRCPTCKIEDSKQNKLLHVKLAKDINEYHEDDASKEYGATADIDMSAYIEGDADIYPNRSYRFNGTQTTAWNGQHAVLYVHKTEPIETSMESFKMDQYIHDILTIFKPRAGETIAEHLERRYKVFANAAGVTGRRELFFINDLVYFSPIEIKNKMLPEVKRGWVEAIIAGDPRTCKTMISKFLHKHYKVGEVIGGSSGVSRAGLIGGITFFKNKAQLSWGKVPMNDGGMIIIDEMSEIEPKTLIDLTDIRSEGIAELTMVKSGKVSARTRKIMLSNPRPWKDEEKKEYSYGIQFLRDLCLQDRVLARFDIGFVVRRGDVDVSEFESDYSEISTEFNEIQCRNLIMWAYSRSPDQIIFEDGFNKYVNEINVKMNEKFHSSTQLINQERAKLVRLSVSLATMLYSTVNDDWNKILVKKIHLDYIAQFLDFLYCHPNMKMDQYSKMKQSSETLGNMKFMMNICDKIDINPLFREEEFSETRIHQIFNDYLTRVANGTMYLIDAKSDDSKSTRLHSREGNQKLIGVLTARNCFSITKRGNFKKTAMFNNWLEERITLGERAEKSDILELEQNKQNLDVVKRVKEIGNNRGKSQERKAS